jgi:hypothetical protein
MKNIFSKLIYTFVFFAFVSVHAQRGIGTNTPNSSAVLELKSSTKGFLPPRLSMSEAILIGTPAEGLTFYCTDCDVKGLFFYNGSSFVGVVDGLGLTNTVTGQNGTVWMDRNLGASQIATTFNDAASYGDYYQWGTAFPEWNSGGGSTDDTAWNGSSKGSQDPCPVGFRVPTSLELEVEMEIFFDSSVLRLPAGGYRDSSDGELENRSVYGNYWSSLVSAEDSKANEVFFIGDDAGASPVVISTNRRFGLLVRCIKE